MYRAIWLATAAILTTGAANAVPVTLEFVTEVTAIREGEVRLSQGDTPLTAIPSDLAVGIGDTLTYSLVLDDAAPVTGFRDLGIFASSRIEDVTLELSYPFGLTTGPVASVISLTMFREGTFGNRPNAFFSGPIRSDPLSDDAPRLNLSGIDFTNPNLDVASVTTGDVIDGFLADIAGIRPASTAVPYIFDADGTPVICSECNFKLVSEVSSILIGGEEFLREDPFLYDGDIIPGEVIAAVPLPAGLPLLLGGLIGLFGIRKLRNS